jgi:DNA-binding NarL/FixJ family response regulator
MGRGGGFAVTPKGIRTAVLFEHSQLWLHSLERVLPPMGLRVCGAATSVEEVISLIELHRPDLLIAGMDAGPNAVGALSCIRRALEHLPELQVIIWSNIDEPRAVRAAFAAGAAAYVLKTARPDDILLAIRQTYERSFYLANERPVGDRPARANAAAASNILTAREIEILQLVAEGYSNAQLAQMVWVTEDTIKFHLSNIYQKLEVANRTEASRWAHLHGVVLPQGATPASTA